MSYNQPNDERAAFAPDGYAPVSFGEHGNEKNMWVDTLRAAGTAPTVLRGQQMSAETEIFVEANHILTGDPAWVRGLWEAPDMGSLPVISQPVAHVPGHAAQVNGYYPGPTQAAEGWHGMEGYGAGYNDGYRAGAAQSIYSHYPGAGQAAYGYGNPPVAYPMAHGSTDFAHQAVNSWNSYPVPGASSTPYAGPTAMPQKQRHSRSPVKQPTEQTLAYRRRSPPELNPMAPSFAPPFFPAPPAHLSYPPLSDPPSYPTVQNHNLGAYGGVPARGAWGFSGGAHAATPYQTRLNEARVLVGQQRRFSPGSDDVRNHISSGSASNEEEAADGAEQRSAEEEDVADEHESNAGDASAEEEDSEEEGVEEETDSSDQEDEAEAPIPRKRRGKFHAGNKRLVCDNCHEKHYKCVKPDPNKPCVGCMKARGGPKECKITRAAGT